ncbi:MAG TPA: 3,4-dihydroxy-2-butanone-4-phosphate synthase, partial [Phycisphaerales bacterium]|nr:3,4-dihydroxy-2-butanone-4-phosphate synthase [Phycisphaerales bacterium]
RLDLHPQSAVNTSLRGTPLTVSVDGHPRHGVGTGISAHDRVKTIQLLLNPQSKPDDFVRPGHINPLRARDGGVLVRTGQTEGCIDLMRLAGLKPAAVLIEVVLPSGEMARRPHLELIAAEHNLKICSVEQIIHHRLERETLISRIDPINGTPLQTPYGQFNLLAYHSVIDPLPHLALTVGNVGRLDSLSHRPIPVHTPTLVRMHKRDLLGDIFDDLSNPTGPQLRASLKMLQQTGSGALVYLRTQPAGDELRDRLQQIRFPQTRDINTPDFSDAKGLVPLREFGIGSQILRDLGLTRIRALTNHPKSLPGLSAFGLELVEQIPIAPLE